MDATIAYEKLMRRVMMMRGARAHRIDWRDERLEALELRGRGLLPPLVFMHGFSASGPTQWATVATRLRRHHRRLFVPDLPGHGESQLSRPLNAELMLEASRALLMRMTASEPAIVVASSMSGGIATRLASQHPKRVRGLLLCSPGGAPLDPQQIAQLRELFAVDTRRKALTFVDHVFARPPITRPIIAWGARRQLRRPHLVALLRQLEQQPWLTPQELRTLSMPVKLLWGSADRVLPLDNFLFFQKHLPPGSIIERPDYGHAPFLEAPIQLADSVLAFARRVVDEPPRRRGRGPDALAKVQPAPREEESGVESSWAEPWRRQARA